MSKRKRILVWLALVVFFSIGSTALWFKLQVDEQPTHHEEPDIPEVELPLPDPDDEDE